MTRLPSVSLAAVPGRRLRTLELARELEARGFAGVYGPSMGDVVSLCLSLAHVTERVPFGSTIQPIYLRRADELAGAASYVAEVSGGRFRLGLGVTHPPVHRRLGVEPGRPLADMRAYVADLRAAVGEKAPQPTIVLAALRDKMLALAVEIADGAVWANAARSHAPKQVAQLPAERRGDGGFWLANMVPTVVSDDREAAAAVCRRTLTSYAALPSYRAYWKEAGYEAEMAAVEKALQARDMAGVAAALSDRWLADVTLFGSAAEVREGVEAWWDTGVEPIVVPSAVAGGQLQAFDDLFAAFA